MNPRPPECKSFLSAFRWEEFEKWLLSDKKPKTAREILNYARRYFPALESGNLSEIIVLPPAKRRVVLASLSNLAKFLGVYDYWRGLVHKYGVKWTPKEVRERQIIDRISRKRSLKEIYDWVRRVKAEVPELSDFMILLAVTGMRMIEAVESYNLIISLSKEGRLNEYYNPEMEVLEHYKFKDRFLRKSKKAFFSFAPRSIIERIAEEGKPLTRNMIQLKIKRRKLRLRFGDLREAWASIMTKYLSQPEIDFLQGRVGLSIFMQNYFNPALIRDLKDRAKKGINEILSNFA